MRPSICKTENLDGSRAIPVYCSMAWSLVKMIFKRENWVARRHNGVSLGDALFNLKKMDRLRKTLVRYRHPVGFGDVTVMDSATPPYPSRAFDKRMSNYLNHLDMSLAPSGIVSLSTTNCCPYSCKFCSTNARRRTQDDLEEELLKKTITQVEDLGVPFIILHGGEPMVQYDRFLRLVRHVRDETCLWMFTTGYGVTAERARELRDNGLFGVWVSLDHYDPDAHNRLRGHGQAFENACRAVRLFQEAGIYTCLSLVPPEEFEDPDHFKRYYDFARDLGVAEIRILEMKPSGRQACRTVRPHSKVLEKLQKDLFKDPAYKKHPPISGLSTWLEKDPALGCQCRFEYLFVTSTGEVQPCEAAQISFGNIQEEDFVESPIELAQQTLRKP